MAVTENFRHARLDLFRTRRARKKWLGISRFRHGTWVRAKLANAKDTPTLFESWRRSVAKLHELDRRVSALSEYLGHGATTASLDVAKAVAVWEGGEGSDGLFHAYRDVVGVWTIGYGHTAADGAPIPSAHSVALTRAEATTLLLHDLMHFYAPAVKAAFDRYKWKPNQKMFDALVDFGYNLGSGYFFRGHSVGDAMSTRNARLTAHSLLEYDTAGGQVLSDLQRRRRWEDDLFMGGSYAVH